MTGLKQGQVSMVKAKKKKIYLVRKMMCFELSLFIINWVECISIVPTGYDRFLSCFELHSNPGKDFGQELVACEDTGKKLSQIVPIRPHGKSHRVFSL